MPEITIKLDEETKDFIREMMQELGHEICVGIRMGLYGANAVSDEDGVGLIASAIERIGDAISET